MLGHSGNLVRDGQEGDCQIHKGHTQSGGKPASGVLGHNCGQQRELSLTLGQQRVDNGQGHALPVIESNLTFTNSTLIKTDNKTA